MRLTSDKDGRVDWGEAGLGRTNNSILEEMIYIRLETKVTGKKATKGKIRAKHLTGSYSENKTGTAVFHGKIEFNNLS
jgi:L-alanine-DL-glutamate epimerase-like enolase superfamily enzyme